jgi:hypothetical protein
MREYEWKYPLEVLDTFLYPNLHKDGNNRVISENITWFTLCRKNGTDRTLMEMESETKKDCPNAELAYFDLSGNRWIFLILNGGDPSEDSWSKCKKPMKRFARE